MLVSAKEFVLHIATKMDIGRKSKEASVCTHSK